MVLYNTVSWSAGEDKSEVPEQIVLGKLDFDQQILYQKNWINMILYNNGSWSAGAFIPIEPVQHDVIQHWILISRRCYQKNWIITMLHITESWSAGAIIPLYIALYPDKQETFYQKIRLSMMLKNTWSWSAGDVIPAEPDQHDVI